MIRREFVAAVAGLDRSRWPVQPGVAENAINRFFRLLQVQLAQKPCVWVDSPSDIRRLHESRGSRATERMSVPHTIQRLNNWAFPGRTKLGNWWVFNEQEALELLNLGRINYRTDYADRFRPQEIKQAKEILYDAYVAGAFAVYEYASTRYVLSRPVLHTDERGVLHHERRPAISWFDGPYRYYIHGVQIDEDLMDGSRQIDVDDIYEFDNMEVRRVLIERFGWRKFLRALGAFKIDEDPVHGALWQARPPRQDPDWRRGTMRFLELKDPSTNRRYFIRVPPNRGSALSARAWTFRVPVEQFQLAKET